MNTPAERLRLLYEVTRQLPTFADLDDLLGYATRRTRELFDAEGCSVLLLDPPKREFYFPVSSQCESRRTTEARLAEIRFPADRGIAGWVLTNDEAVLVADAANDSRFYGGVDAVTAMQTRCVLCAPLRSHRGNIGVIEVINPTGPVGPQDLEFLEALASDVAVAHENGAMQRQLRGDLGSLRQMCTIAGIGLGGVGVLTGLGTLVGHTARALPLAELLSHPGAWTSVLLLIVGAVLLALARAR